ncbi:MAG: RNA polymerase sigma factor [Dehalococcoidia bacterium]
MSVTATEESLVLAARARDPVALSQLHEDFFPKLARYGFKHLGDACAAEDFAADVMASVLESIDRYQIGAAPLSAWVFRIARNRLIDISRRNRRRGERPLNWDVASESGADDQVERRLAAVAVREAVDRLPAYQRRVIVLRYFDGHDTATIASLIGRKEGAVKSLRFRALRSLRRIVTEMRPGLVLVARREEARCA